MPSYQTERMRKDGRRVSVMISISPLRDTKGQIVGASAIARDISAQKRSEEALRRNESWRRPDDWPPRSRTRSIIH